MTPLQESPAEQPRFVSLRWRFILPLFIVILIVAMGGAYVLAQDLSGGMEIPQINLLMQSSRSLVERAAEIYERQRQEAQRAAYTVGVVEAVRSHDAARLQTLLEDVTRLAALDSLIVTDVQGIEILGLMRGVDPQANGYTTSAGTNLSSENMIRDVLDKGFIGATGLLRTQAGTLLYTATPISDGRQIVGAVLAGQRIVHILNELHSSAVVNVAFYGPDSQLIQTTFPLEGDTPVQLTLTPEAFNQALTASSEIPLRSLSVGSQPYQAAYLPFSFGPNTLGVIAAMVPDTIPAVTELGRQLTALVMSSVTGIVVIGAFVVTNALIVGRVNRITHVARALTAGEMTARTGMKTSDEIGAMGQALDQYATYVQQRQDELRLTLRRQRREVEHLTAILEALPDGVIVQDIDGQVILMNDTAKRLLGSQRLLRSTDLKELTAVVTDVLGPSLAPGLYALGDPRRVELDGKMLTAQAAAVTNLVKERVGTVILLRDITQQVRLDRARDSLFNRLTRDVQRPLAELAHAETAPQTSLPRELTRHATALQKLIVEMRELSATEAPGIRAGQHPILLETLIWTVANEWRQIAQAANLTLEVQIDHKGLYVLGNERRLRWAIGNLVDNAVKYTPPGGKLSLDILEETNGKANLRIRDNGVGITPEELPHVFTRFYRGTPTTPAGRVIRMPGTGQGLTIAKQIIETHGGSVQIKSKVGVGTAVFLTLPLTAPVSLELPYLQVDMEGETVQLGSDEDR